MSVSVCNIKMSDSKRRSPMRLRSWSFQRLIPFSQAQAASTYFWGQSLVNAAKRRAKILPRFQKYLSRPRLKISRLHLKGCPNGKTI